jgi:hypothetical protein
MAQAYADDKEYLGFGLGNPVKSAIYAVQMADGD